ncbi:MAG: phosphoserine phosphatase SerB [Alphaproteobacteria bacterium]|nr:phosphoserine phosphatase SerB [Alphaproteobacteria bacterium]
MQHVATLISDPSILPLDTRLVGEVAEALASGPRPVGATPDWLAPERAVDLAVSGLEVAAAQAVIREIVDGRPIDFAVLPADARRKHLLICDMDSTIVTNETLDDLAAFAGVGDEVAAITWQSMQGEVDFIDALERRVAMLDGLPATMLEAAYQQVILMPGARTLVRTMRRCGAYTALVSGAFKYFTSRVARTVGFDEEEANELEFTNGRLTGKIIPPIINRDGKVDALLRISGNRGISIADTLAVGDGANDLGMIERAGLGVAFQGKKIVAERAAVRIDHTDLRSLLFIQGFRADEFVD